jgi:hypothetical protein
MRPVFVLGAGFSAEARGLAGSIRGHSIYIGEYEIECGYPLLQDLPAICFPRTAPAVTPDVVEQRLADSILASNWSPIERLCEELQKADYYVASELVGRSSAANPYRAFLSDFSQSSFINFNYDSFVEFGLLNAGTWSPDGGFGVPVGYEVGFTAKPFTVVPSRGVVFHPHGSLLVFTRDFSVSDADEGGRRWIEARDPVDFLFDPHALGYLFYPFTRVGGFGYDPRLSSRVIAPVPAKAEGLKSDFVTAVGERACSVLREAGAATSIGYAFSESDRVSYAPLLGALSEHENPRLTVVSPDASDMAVRLRRDFNRISVDPQPMRFTEWAAAGYPGLAT